MKKKDLVIVESPTKAKTISKILGEDYKVVSSMGHVIDLPQKKLGVDVEKGFEPAYVVIPGRQKVIDDFKKDAKKKITVYVATDPDREGEAIGWQIRERIFKGKNVKRVVFHEITPAAVAEAFKHPREFDEKMVEAQAGRRVLDRIVGYYLSPLLWRKIGRGLSAGRVQSVALKLIIDRERQIKKFIPQEYWQIEAVLRKHNDSRAFTAKLEKIRDEKAQITDRATAARLIEEAKGRDFVVAKVKKTEKKRYAEPPFITSTMQQEAFNKLRYNAAKTMLIAQQLYEGIDIGEETPVGLITYMRTDSPRTAPEAIAEVRKHIEKQYGKEYIPEKPNVFKVKKLAQEAHEAIRPTLMKRPPASLQQYLNPDQYKLYELIYNRFISSQMTPARYQVVSVDITAGDFLFAASGSTLQFDGFTAAYSRNAEEEDDAPAKAKEGIPDVAEGERLELGALDPSQHFTKPPPRYSDSSLVKALEEEGIGRPSTYAPIISTLILRDYARRIKGYFHATELGCKVCDMLVEYFPGVIDVKFTASMEEQLDEIEEGRFTKAKILSEFYAPFKTSLDFAQENIKKEVITTDEVCEKCGKPMVVKWGRRGKFLSCASFPECKHSKSITSGVKCPQEGCGGELIERRSRRGFFYGCSKFPQCTYTSRALPDDNPKDKNATAGGNAESPSAPES